jgi:hypothetical protein
MSFWVILLTQSSLGLGRKRNVETASAPDGPVWRVDLRSVGFTGFVPNGEQWGLHLKPNPLCFTDNNVLVAAFITREKVTTLARRNEQNEPLPLRLHGVFLNTEIGKVRNTKEWFITRPRGGIIAAGDGKFAVLTPAMIALYSSRLEPLKEFKLTSEQQSNLWDFRPSPSGKSIVAEYHNPAAYFEWVDTNSLIPRPTSIPVVAFSISDDDVVIKRSTYVKSKGFLSEILIRAADGSWSPICRVLNGGACGGEPHFLSNDVLAVVSPHDLNILPKTGGEALIKASFRQDEWLGRSLYPSADGKRFAVTVWAHKGGNTLLDIDYHSLLKRIVIYDLSRRQAVYTVDAKQEKIKDVSGVALSPDGSLMAILVDGTVQVYELPSGPTAHPSF